MCDLCIDILKVFRLHHEGLEHLCNAPKWINSVDSLPSDDRWVLLAWKSKKENELKLDAGYYSRRNGWRNEGCGDIGEEIYIIYWFDAPPLPQGSCK